jgi:hypothetical protein
VPALSDAASVKSSFNELLSVNSTKKISSDKVARNKLDKIIRIVGLVYDNLPSLGK